MIPSVSTFAILDDKLMVLHIVIRINSNPQPWGNCGFFYQGYPLVRIVDAVRLQL